MIRPATVSDIPQIMALGKEFADEAGVTARVGWDDAHVEALLQNMIESDEGILLVSEDGMIGGAVYPHPFSGRRVFVEMFWRARDGNGLALLKAAEDAARERGASQSIMVAMDDMDRTRRLYKALGYAPIEAQFMKDLG